MPMSEKPVLLVTRKLSPAVEARAARDYQARFQPRGPGLRSKDELIARCQEVDAVLPCHSEIFSAEVIAALPARLKIIANHSVGTDHVDLAAAKAKGIVVTNTPGRAVRRDGRDRHALPARRRPPRQRGRPLGAREAAGTSGARLSWSAVRLRASASASSAWVESAGSWPGAPADSTWKCTTTTAGACRTEAGGGGNLPHEPSIPCWRVSDVLSLHCPDDARDPGFARMPNALRSCCRKVQSWSTRRAARWSTRRP